MGRRKKNHKRKKGAPAQELQRVDSLVTRGREDDALAALDKLAARFPGDLDVLERLAVLLHDTGQDSRLRAVCRKLVALAPGRRRYLRYLIDACRGHVATVSRLARRFVESFPDDPTAAVLREELPELERLTAQTRAELGLPDESMVVLHEETLMLLAENELPAAREKAEALLARCPDFVRGWNNRVEIAWHEGDLQGCRDALEQALGRDPTNLFALSVQARVELVERGASRATLAASLRAAAEGGPGDHALKLFETLSWLGDFEGVLAAYERWGEEPVCESPYHASLYLHYAAVAAARAGQDGRARALWKRALSLHSHQTARENLDDLERAIDARNGAWPLPLQQWLPQMHFEVLMRWSKKRSPSTEGLLRQLPIFETLLPLWLGWGCPRARQLALLVGAEVQRPAIVDALRDFATGRWGTLAQRQDVIGTLNERDQLDQKTLAIWVGGKQTSIIANRWSISWEPTEPCAPAIATLMRDALEALRTRDGERAEELLREALAISPTPAVRNNLAAAWELQGRKGEAYAELDRLIEEFPAYLFSRAAKAQLFAQEERFDEAQALLDPFFAVDRLHISEFRAMCATGLSIAAHRRDADAVETWIDMWEGIEPDTRALREWRSTLEDLRKAQALRAVMARWKTLREGRPSLQPG